MTGQSAASDASKKSDIKLQAAANAGVAPRNRKATQPTPPPREAPKFSVADIRAAIPAHCFERSMVRSFGHVAMDLVVVGVLGWIGLQLYGMALPLPVAAVVWPLFWFAQGAAMTGLWVLAHECGHQAFSASKRVNNAVGLVLHSALLVPYHSWRISHGNHHKNTCSMENDEVFVPPVSSADAKDDHDSAVKDAPIMHLIGIFNMLLFGWPLYLVLNIAGPAKHANQPNSHFNPHSVLFKATQVKDVIVSDAGLLVVVGALAAAGVHFGWTAVLFHYFMPYLVVNAFLVAITYLQHTAVYIPHYREEEFTWLRGALSTVDRSFGPVLNYVLHHITDTHVAHHLFHTMPFYHAQEATEAIKKVLGPYYLVDETPIFSSLMHSWQHCRFVEDKGAYLMFKTK